MKRCRSFLSLLFICAVAGVAAHVWVVNKGVHFKNRAIDFGNPPPVYVWRFPDEIEPGSDKIWRPGTKQIMIYEDEPSSSSSAEIEGLRKALEFEKQKHYSKALAVYKKLDFPANSDQGFIRRRIQILEDPALRKDKSWFDRLLKVTRLSPSDPVPDPAAAPQEIRPYLAYASASQANEYLEVAVKYPKAWIADSALIMAVRAGLGSGNPSVTEISIAKKAISKLRNEYPKSRFVRSTHQWEGRIFLLKGQFGKARAVYRKWVRREPQSAMAHTSLIYAERVSGREPEAAMAWMRFFESGPPHYRSYAFSRSRNFLRGLTSKDRTSLISLLASEPALAPTYFTIRIDTMDPVGRELQELLAQGQKLLPSLPVVTKGHVCSRLAEIAYHLKRDADALRFAASVPGRADTNDLARAAFVRGSVLNRRGKRAGALKAFRQLLQQYPKSYLVGGAKENIALISERQGDLASALDAYYELKYPYDIAYMVDARMTPAQLSSYIKSRPNHKDRMRLLYSLGLRYLRVNQLDNATSALLRLTKLQRRSMITPYQAMVHYDDVKSLQDPMQTIKSIRWLDNQIAKAKTANSKARWMFSKADYFYTRRNLLFYNPALWQGNRAYVLTFSWQDTVATSAGKSALRKHHYDHEVLVHVSKICDAILIKYPKSPIAPNAAFRSAVALNRLRDLNEYWREEDLRSKLSARVRNRKDWLIKHFPAHPLVGPASKPVESQPEW